MDVLVDDYEGAGPDASSCIAPLPCGLSSGECPEVERAAHGAGERAPTRRSDKVGHRVFSNPIRPDGVQGSTPEHTGVPVHAICEALEKAYAQVLISGRALRREELPHRACGGCEGRPS